MSAWRAAFKSPAARNAAIPAVSVLGEEIAKGVAHEHLRLVCKQFLQPVATAMTPLVAYRSSVMRSAWSICCTVASDNSPRLRSKRNLAIARICPPNITKSAVKPASPLAIGTLYSRTPSSKRRNIGFSTPAGWPRSAYGAPLPDHLP